MRRWRFVSPVVVVVFAAACKFDPPADVDFDAAIGDEDADMSSPDAAAACSANTIICTNDRYVECSASGIVEFEMQCPLGCDDGAQKCIDVDPSNGVATYLDRAASDDDVIALVLGEGSTLDTESGVVFDGGASVEVPSVVVGDYRVFMVKSLSISGTTTVTGTRALVVVSDGDVAITATLDVSANGPVHGPGGGPGICDGSNSTSSGSIAGGAGGGGRGEAGGQGGAGDNGAASGASGGPAITDLSLEPLRGGCPGGVAIVVGSTCTGFGGGGGGAIQITSRTRIELSGSGVIDASGGGGVPASPGENGCVAGNIRAGSGGGSGGGILLEAPQVILSGSNVVLSTKGGGGSSPGAVQAAGSDGGTGETPASGGIETNGEGHGGTGGTGAFAAANGGAGDPNRRGGGGGGGAGRTRINTSSGSVNPFGGASIRSHFSTGTLRTRLVPNR